MFKTILKVFVCMLVLGFGAIQFFRIDHTNPPINSSDTFESAVLVPPDIALILGRSCNDCHSHKTIYPWYSYLQPSAWFLRDHVDHGRSHLNFSIFNTYDSKKKRKALEEICEEVEAARMPLPSYLWLHRDAVLTANDGKALCDWANAEIERIE